MSCVDVGTSFDDHPVTRMQSRRATSSRTRCGFSHSNLDVLTTWSQTPNAYPAAKLLKPRPNFATFQVIAPGLVDTTAARVEDPKLIAESLLRYVRAWASGGQEGGGECRGFSFGAF